MSDGLRRLMQREAIEAEVCYEFERNCGVCQWCRVRDAIATLDLPWQPREP